MQTTTRSDRFGAFLATMLLGLVMAAGISAIADPELAWLGFALAAMYATHGSARRPCAPRVRVGSRR